MINEISLIPVEQLMHHPDNPRFDLGDLEELTASIRANGVLQNLTVVHAIRKMDETERARIEELYSQVQTEELRQRLETGEYEDPNMYWVVIGNRRFEAAQMAGLTELPCVIAEMNRHEQLATMLQENMQRNDLTIYEQSQSFQLMLDLFDEKLLQRSGLALIEVEVHADMIRPDNFSHVLPSLQIQDKAVLMPAEHPGPDAKGGHSRHGAPEQLRRHWRPALQRDASGRRDKVIERIEVINAQEALRNNALGIEDRGHKVPDRQEHAPQELDVPEKHETAGQEHAQA